MTERMLCLRFEVDKSHVALMEYDSTPEDDSTPRIIEESSGFRSCGNVEGESHRFVDYIARTLRAYLRESEVKPSSLTTVTVTTPGAVDPARKKVLSASRIGIHKDADLASELEKQFDLPVRVFNDADCVAAYEHLRINPKPRVHLILTVGLGIGSTLIVNDETYRGAGHAGHIGRAPLVPYSSLDFCLEDFASQAGVSRTLRRVLSRQLDSDRSLPEDVRTDKIRACRRRIAEYDPGEEIPTRDVTEAIQLGDPAVVQVIDEAARFLAGAVATAILHANPNRITCVGDIFEIPGFWDKLKSYTEFFSWREAFESVRLVRGENESGRQPQFLGCALLARHHFSTG